MIQHAMKAFLFVILGTTMILAQGTTGSISGTAMDETGGVLPGITVTVTNVGTSNSRTVVSNDSGRYTVSNLQVGSYEVKGELTGFQTSIRAGIELSLGRSLVVDLTMTVGEISQQVTVTGEASLVETTQTSLSGLVTTTQIQDLPLNGRNFVQLTLLEAGVSNALKASAATRSLIAGFGLDITVAGGRPNANTFLLDGTDLNDHRNKLPGSVAGIQLGVDSVAEFKMLTANYSAEYGRAGGGVIIAVTKSGTNAFNGSLFWVHRNDVLDATNFFANSSGTGKDPLVRNQFGASVGGPIVQDRTFFFASWESLRDRRGLTSIMTVPTEDAKMGIIPGIPLFSVAPEIQPYLFLYPTVNGRDFGDGTGEHAFGFSEPTDEDYFVVKIDHNLSDNHSIFGRYTIDYADNLGRSNTVVMSETSSQAHYITLEEKSIFSPNLLNVISYALARTTQTNANVELISIDPSLYFIPESEQLGSIRASGLTQANPYDDHPRFYTQNMFQFNDTVSYNTGRHSLKFGVDIKRYQYNALSVSRWGGRWSFDSVEDYLMNNPEVVESQIPGADFRRGMRQTIYGFYAQDDFQLRPNLTINLGLRYEPMGGISEVNDKMSNLNDETALGMTFESECQCFIKNPSKKNFSPRIGIAWDPSGDGKTSIRVAYGVFHDTVALYWFQQSAFRSPPAGTVRNNAPVWPDPFTGLNTDPVTPENPSGPITAYSFPDHAMNNPYAQKWNLNIQREIVPGTVGTIGYIGSRGVKLADFHQFQICAPEFVNGRQFFREGCSLRSTAEFPRIEVRGGRASSFYHAFIAKMTRRFSQGLFLQGSYTYSKVIDDMSGNSNGGELGGVTSFGGTYDDPDLRRGLAGFDVRNNLIMNGSWALPTNPGMSGVAAALLNGWQLNGILTLSDGYPVMVTTDRRNNFSRSASGAYSPNLIPGGDNNPVLGGPDQYFDPSQFVLVPHVEDPTVLAGCGPAPNRCSPLGDNGRNTLIAPGVATFDFSVMKNFVMGFLGEDGAFQFRAEFFNIFNRTNFNTPDRVLFRSRGRVNGSAGRINSTATTERQIQVGLKIIF